MTPSEWFTLAIQVAANVVVVATAVSRLHARLAVIETKLVYVERELHHRTQAHE